MSTQLRCFRDPILGHEVRAPGQVLRWPSWPIPAVRVAAVV
ncbi:hypothetical protein [Mycobacterium leprae]|nr:hypothetical protein [Mycobacterium leprae]